VQKLTKMQKKIELLYTDCVQKFKFFCERLKTDIGISHEQINQGNDSFCPGKSRKINSAE